MSASPANPSGAAQNGPRQPVPRLKPKTNPLRPINRKPAVRKPVAPRSPVVQPTTSQPAQSNVVSSTAAQPPTQSANAPSPNARPSRSTFLQPARSPTPEGDPAVVKVYMSKKDFVDGLRYHIARLQSRKTVDITNEAEYTRPVRLHRRDRGIHPVAGPEAMELDAKEVLANEKERERLEAIKAERQRIREENAKHIAPTVNPKRKGLTFKKKTEQVFRPNDTPEEQKRYQLRYEEALPWHLEDFDNKHTWEGSFQDTFVGSHVLLMPSPEGHFQLIPVEKRYNFTEQNKVRHIATMEEAEEMMAKKLREPRWVTEAHRQQQLKRKLEKEAGRAKGLFERKGGRDEQLGSDAFDQPEEAADADDIDFNYQEDFADDEENDLFEGDEETTKEAEKRIQKEQYRANVFDLNDEKEVDEEEERNKKLRELEKAAGKRTRKMLRQKGGDFNLYESDTDQGPGGLRQSDSSSEDDEDEESAKREDERKDQERTKSADRDGGRASGASSRGTNTPSGRGKTADLLKSTMSLAAGSLKRPGSPNLSDASGNESTRKKAKKTHPSGTATPRGTLGPDGERSRQGSQAPNVAVRKQSAFGAGSASDTDSRNKRVTLKLNVGRKPGDSRGGTPGGSRAGSPAAQPPPTGSKNGSRPGSPTNPTPNAPTQPSKESTIRTTGQATSSKRSSKSRLDRGSPHGPSPLSRELSGEHTEQRKATPSALPTPAEILEKIPPSGILLPDLTKMFRSRGINASNLKAFAALVRSLTDWDKETKLLRPKPNLNL